jgi:hypothetical protein
MSVIQLVRNRIERLRGDALISTRALLDCGPRATVDQSLSRLTRAGHIHRVARGWYARTAVSAEHVIDVIIGRVIPGRVAALEAFGLIAPRAWNRDQMYGQFRGRVRIDGVLKEIKAMGRTLEKLGDSMAARAMVVIQALGEQKTTRNVIAKINAKLEPSDWEALWEVRLELPRWFELVIARVRRKVGVIRS